MHSDLQISRTIHATEPTKNCTVCGNTIMWRRWLARNWENIVYCGASCRRLAVVRSRATNGECFGRSGHTDSEAAASAA
jgi:hypothetical protein